MSIQVTRLLTAGKTRVNGEEVHVQGSGFMLLPSSYAPANLRIAVDSHEGNQMPALPGVFIRQDFRHLWVFHDLAGGSYPEPLTIITLDDAHAYILPGDAAFRGNVHDASMAGIVAAGNTQVLAPVSGRRTRITAYRYQLSADATLAVAGEFEMVLQSTGIGVIPETAARFYVPDASPAGAFGSLDTGWIELPPAGFLLGVGEPSLVFGRVNVQLNVALATGEAIVQVRYRRERDY